MNAVLSAARQYEDPRQDESGDTDRLRGQIRARQASSSIFDDEPPVVNPPPQNAM